MQEDRALTLQLYRDDSATILPKQPYRNQNRRIFNAQKLAPFLSQKTPNKTNYKTEGTFLTLSFIEGRNHRKGYKIYGGNNLKRYWNTKNPFHIKPHDEEWGVHVRVILLLIKLGIFKRIVPS